MTTIGTKNMMNNNNRNINSFLVLLIIIIIIWLIGNHFKVHADYVEVPHQRLIDVSDWVDQGWWTEVKVIYDKDGHVDCYLYRRRSTTDSQVSISCIQK